MKHLSISLLLAAGVLASSAYGAELLSEQTVAIQLQENVEVVTLYSTSPVTVTDAEHTFTFSEGLYSFSTLKTESARERFHLFAKTFQPEERKEEKAYLKSWRKLGYSPESILIGKELKTKSGRKLDARVHWISIAQFGTEAEAQAKKSALEKEEQWTWLRSEITRPGSGTIKLKTEEGTFSLRLPIQITSPEDIAVANVDVGFWDEDKKHLSYGGTLELGVTAEGGLEVLEHLPVEEYLKGVLPSEMPAVWPAEALKAQAVSARSEVLVNLSTKHSLDLFDYCSNEHCRAYRGVNLHKASTNRVLEDTRGEILVQNNEIVPTVFSANCGGWTENNDTVWFGPPNAALRGTSDLAKNMASPFASAKGIRDWLEGSSSAFCAGDKTGFRWTLRYSESEIHDMIKKSYDAGRIQQIELGERGVSGRLKWIRIHGSAETVTVKKELPIRRLFGGLPSAMFDLTVTGAAPNRRYEIRGAGRGHGVGLCQHGAHGMALEGFTYSEILHHYFTDIRIERVE